MVPLKKKKKIQPSSNDRPVYLHGVSVVSVQTVSDRRLCEETLVVVVAFSLLVRIFIYLFIIIFIYFFQSSTIHSAPALTTKKKKREKKKAEISSRTLFPLFMPG